MKPKRIILVRHGESQGNVDSTIYDRIPDYALELTPKGCEQALNAGKNLKQIIGDESVCFYISPMWRTRSTFEQILKGMQISNPEFNEEPRIREQEWGHLRSETETAEISKYKLKVPPRKYDSTEHNFQRPVTLPDFSSNAELK